MGILTSLPLKLPNSSALYESTQVRRMFILIQLFSNCGAQSPSGVEVYQGEGNI